MYRVELDKHKLSFYRLVCYVSTHDIPRSMPEQSTHCCCHRLLGSEGPVPRAPGRLAFSLPRCSHVLPLGNPPLAEDVWKLFWDCAQDFCLLSLLLTTAKVLLCRQSMTLDFPHTLGDSYQFLPALPALTVLQPFVPLLLSEVHLQAVLNLERDGSR